MHAEICLVLRYELIRRVAAAAADLVVFPHARRVRNGTRGPQTTSEARLLVRVLVKRLLRRPVKAR